MTARCLTFPHCPGLRRAEQVFCVCVFFSPWPSRVPLGIIYTCGCRKLSQKGYQYSQLNCREEPRVGAREQMCGRSH